MVKNKTKDTHFILFYTLSCLDPLTFQFYFLCITLFVQIFTTFCCHAMQTTSLDIQVTPHGRC